LTDWLGESWTPNSGRKAAHPNGRFTTPAAQCPVIDPAWEDPKGVPISAFIFGGRRSSVVPLIYEAMSWAHGVFIGASVSSEMTAAAKGEIGKLRHDPFAMLPFCGYHMGDYFGHWLYMGEGEKKQLPRIFHVNWFRKDNEGKFLWPGYGDNSRVLKWIFERTDELAPAQITPIGYLPTEESLDLSGLKISKEAMHQLLTVDKNDWKKEAAELKSYFSIFGDKLPKGISDELAHLEKRLGYTVVGLER
jgi:phosphoenolpyruvate carboxykinase (GTP)